MQASKDAHVDMQNEKIRYKGGACPVLILSSACSNAKVHVHSSQPSASSVFTCMAAQAVVSLLEALAHLYVGLQMVNASAPLSTELNERP